MTGVFQKIGALNRWKKVFEEKSKQIAKNSLEHPHLKARILGYLMGDGPVTINKEKNGELHYGVSFYPDDEAMLKSYLDAFKIVYGITPKIRTEINHFRARIDSKPITLDLLSYGSFKSLEWQIPRAILNSKLASREWLRAFYDSEGYVGKRTIVIQSVNYGGLAQVKELLQSYNIDSKFYTYHRKNKNWNTNYLLCITRNSERIKFLKEIGFSHSKKQNKLIASVTQSGDRAGLELAECNRENQFPQGYPGSNPGAGAL